jgi:hypothetical protein
VKDLYSTGGDKVCCSSIRLRCKGQSTLCAPPLRERVAWKEIEFAYCLTVKMVADYFTGQCNWEVQLVLKDGRNQISDGVRRLS